MAYATEGDTSSRRVHWLRDDDMLPAQFPTARIFTYDWRSNTYDGASTQHFHTHAHKLLSHLSRARRGVCWPHSPKILRNLILFDLNVEEIKD